MVKLKNNSVSIKQFGLILTFLFLISCNSKRYYVTKIEGKKIGVENNTTDTSKVAQKVENYIKPYRDNIDTDLNKILSYSTETLEKSKGKWQTNIGNFLADVTLQKSNFVFNKRENKTIDICLLNHGGIRSIIPKGEVSSRTAFEVMPFENTAIIIGLKSEQIFEIVNYLISEKKPHPIKGLTFVIDKNGIAKNILVNKKPLEDNKIYYVVTSDYLSNGGDNMTFFSKGVEKHDIDYKLRNILIDYFKEVDTITFDNTDRIIEE